jgi:hypothetical protein
VEPIWRRLAGRAYHLGRSLPKAAATTRDPAPLLWTGGRGHRPIGVASGRYRFATRPCAGAIRLLSRLFVPCDLSPWIEDRRRLGVSVSRIVWHDRSGSHDMPMDHPSLTDGWWAVEKDGEQLRRWTTGNALLPLPPAAIMVEIEMTGGVAYPIERASAAGAARPLRHRRRSLRQASSAIAEAAVREPIDFENAGFIDLAVPFGWRHPADHTAISNQPGSDWLPGNDWDAAGAKSAFRTARHLARNGRNRTAEIVSMAIAAQASSID